jgi:hypothetical protein
MKPLEVEVLDAELIKVCLTENGFTSCCFVTSHHLVEDKRRQLLDDITKQAIDAYEPA